MIRAAIALLILLLAGPQSVEGQATAAVDPGDRIRVRAGSDPGVYTVVEANDDEVALTAPGGESSLLLSWSSISKLDVSQGELRSGRKFVRGATSGFFTGAAAGVGMASGDDASGYVAFSAEQKALIFGVFLGGIGGLIGGPVSLQLPGERWETVWEGAQLGVVHTAGGKLGFALRARSLPPGRDVTPDRPLSMRFRNLQNSAR
jgi:hypothetical protein